LEADMLKPSVIVLSLAMIGIVLDVQVVSAQTNQGRSAKGLNARTAAPSKSAPPQRPASGEKSWMDRASESHDSGGGGM
jgi:hypothetical protein